MLSSLARKISQSNFVITAEVAPPKGSGIDGLLKAAAFVAPHVDAVNVTDNQGATMRMSALAAAAVLVREGIEPVLQLTCRDRNRLALQSDLLGAAALGIRNVLALTGDAIGCGDHRQGKAVFDLDSVSLLRTIKAMNSGHDLNGTPLEAATAFYYGAAAAPEVEPFAVTLPKLAQKAEAGAGFFQTQAVFSPEKLAAFCEAVSPSGVTVIAGILVLRSAKMAEFINRNIPGLRVPETIVERLRSADDPAAEGISIAADMAARARSICGGIHIMSMGRDHVVPEIALAAS